MSKHDDTIRLRHMLDHALEAINLVQSKSRSDLNSERLLQLGLIRLIEIVGEAAARVTKQTQMNYADIPWPQIISMRNRLIHGYDAIDLDILWQTLQEDLPQLSNQLSQVLAEIDRQT